ncbi:MAG: hypothetical protein CMM05_03515 [Rhodopirellula sp.]|nr:hypothetical protein [Rhodopirellula sp.]
MLGWLPIRVSAVGSVTVGEDSRTGRLRMAAKEGRKNRAGKTGQEIFLETVLSHPEGQACVSCHLSSAAFVDPRPVSPGAVRGHNGRRNAPSLIEAACELARCDG